LSIARDIAAAHGGWIELQEKAGAGNRFLLWIPVKAGQEA
jgi:signal transduction histidine kinase